MNDVVIASGEAKEEKSLTETERLAIEEAAKAEGVKQAEQDEATRQAAQAALEAAGTAYDAKAGVDSLRAEIDALRASNGELATQVMNLTGAVDALMAEAIDDTTETKIDDTVEVVPPAATEPKKRKRGWA